jgi:hypothetical protein
MKLKIGVLLVAAMLFSVVSGGFLSAVSGLPPIPVTVGLLATSFISNIQPSGSYSYLRAGLYREVWTKDVIRLVDESMKETFLDGIMDLSRYVTGDEEHQTIHSTYFNAYPDVLVDNTTYPIDLQTLDGADKTISLNKYQTKVTPITDDELNALTYDKNAEVKVSHAQAIAKERLKMSVHNLSPSGHTSKTPIIKTTGAKTPAGDRLRLTWTDIITLRDALQKGEIPIEGVRLVLCAEHVNDLLLEDKDLFNVLTNFKAGITLPQLGFDIRSYPMCPYYKVSDLTKLSYGGTVVSGTHRMASFIFTPSLARKAKGITKTYLSNSKDDPQYQRSLFSVRDYFIAKPILEGTHLGAIVSAIPEN